MSETQRLSLLELLKSGPPLSDLTVPQMRAAYEQMGQITPVESGVQLVTESAYGVPVEIGSGEGGNSGRTLLYFHGGGYTIGSVASHRGMVSILGEMAGARTVTPEYRQAPEHPYPQPLEDGLAVYKWLLDNGTSPTDIAFGGDSAGGGMAVAIMLMARDAGLPMPCCAVLLSPLTDLTASGETIAIKADADVLVTLDDHVRLCSIYLDGADPKSPFASPIFASLRGLPPLCIHVGTSEALLDDSVRLARQAMLDDVAVQLVSRPLMQHVWPMYSAILDEGRETLREAGEWVRRH